MTHEATCEDSFCTVRVAVLEQLVTANGLKESTPLTAFISNLPISSSIRSAQHFDLTRYNISLRQQGDRKLSANDETR